MFRSLSDRKFRSGNFHITEPLLVGPGMYVDTYQVDFSLKLLFDPNSVLSKVPVVSIVLKLNLTRTAFVVVDL